VKRLPELDPIGLTGCYIAGGAVLSAVTRTEIADYDIYPKNKQALLDVCMTLADANTYVVSVTDRAITFKSNDIIMDNDERAIFQVMRFTDTDTPDKIFSAFDFTVCMGAYDCDTKQYTFHDDFWPDVASKSLRFNPGTKFPLNSLIRMQKYIKKGYTSGKGEIAKIALAVANKGMPSDWRELEQQLGGIYGRELKLKVEEIPFSFEAAIEILSALDYNSRLEDQDFSWVRKNELEVLCTGEIPQQYSFASEPIAPYHIMVGTSSTSYFKLNADNSLSKGKLHPNLAELIPEFSSNTTPLKEAPGGYITAWKHLQKDKDGNLIGAVYSGDHNGVTYSVGKETEWNKSPYLFAYLSKTATSGSNKVVAKVRIPVDSIVAIDSLKICTKKMELIEIIDKK